MMPESMRSSAALRSCCGLVSVLLLLAGCASGGAAGDREARVSASQKGESEWILDAEDALRTGDCRRAAESYLAAARASSDPAVASRASQLGYGCEQFATAKAAAHRWLELAPHSGDAALAGALVALRLHDLPESRRLLTLWSDSGSIATQDPLRFTELLENEVGATVVHQVFSDVLVGPDPTATVKLAQARLAFGAQDMRAAIAAAQAAQAMDTDLTEAAVIELRARAVLGEYDAAISAARALGDRLDEENAFLVADLLVAADRHDEARRELDRLSAKPETRLGAERRLVGLAIEEGNLDAAQARLEPLLGERGGAAIALYYLAQVYEQRGDTTRALQSYRLLADSSFGMQARVAAARLLLKNGQPQQALALLDDYAAANPDRRVEMAVTRAQLRAQAGGADDAVKDLEAMLERYPDHPDLLYQKATVLETGGRSREAIALLEQLDRARPEDPLISNALGYTMADNNQRLPRAEQNVRKALAVSPDSPAIQDSYGWVLFKQGRIAEAVPVLERAWLNSHDSEIAAHFGEVLWKNGEEGRARYLWQQALARDPDDALLRSTVARLTGEAPPAR